MNHPLRPLGFFVLRSPLLPLAEWSDPGRTLEGPAAAAAAPGGEHRDESADGVLATALERDRLHLRRQLAELLLRPEVREALWLASPGLFDRLGDWAEAPGSERGQAVERPLVRYHARMTGRATPFGLFAAWSLGDIDDETALTLGPRAHYQRVSRLDMGYVGALCRALEQHPALLSTLVLRPNTSLFRGLDRLRYVAVATAPGGGRRYRFMAARGTEALDETLDRAAAGASLDALAQGLVEPDISLDDARDFVREQVQHQILETDLAPMLTGGGPDDAIASTLGRCTETAPLGAAFAEVRSELAALDAAGVGNDVERYRAIAGRLSALVPSVSIDLARLFQVDLIKPAAGERLRLGGPPLAELLRAVAILHRVSGAPPADDPLSAFREAFVRRYGDRQLPLAQLVDDDLGIAFERADSALHMPLVKGLSFPPTPSPRRWGRRERFLYRRIGQLRGRGAAEPPQPWHLSEEDLLRLEGGVPPPLPSTLTAMATLVAGSRAALEAGEFQLLLRGAFGPSAATFFGRMCLGYPELDERVRAVLRAEEATDPDAIFAEIVHLPEARVGNVICRPVLRDYEIPYLGRSSAPVDRQIPITDLWVSVRGDRVVLWSARLGRRVLPRLTSAHNFAMRNNLPLYRFLGWLQGQGVASALTWNWGALDVLPALPRVVVGRAVLARAQWRVEQHELRELGAARGDTARFHRVQRWRARRRFPRHVLLQDADNLLPVDLDNVLSVESFVHLVKNRDEAVLLEMFPGPDELVAEGPEGRFVHELMVPLASDAGAGQREDAGGRHVVGAATQRTWEHGWSSLRLEGSSAALEGALLYAVPRLLGAPGAGRWCFVRTFDAAGAAIELFFERSTAEEIAGKLTEIATSLAPALDEGRLSRLSVCRDGPPPFDAGAMWGSTAEIMADLFHHDSVAALHLLRVVPAEEPARPRLAAHSLARLSTALRLDGPTRTRVARAALGPGFATAGPGGEAGLDDGANGLVELAEITAALDRRAHALSGAAAALERIEPPTDRELVVVRVAVSCVDRLLGPARARSLSRARAS
ncbi:Lantibiotic dehydratase, C terminus [Nannocystis exedens]|uniref:Lantibiotic dehydratase, C terminus n=1 Tax=Nannocystis exedens TaxID=54 RepID=A0A1I2GR93_9BACT|nr:lantibiotic dehydratase [Nannocystis exedens]PCC68745.1 hypothetical protein NAEX_01762 [Nannocystis exedens]SFF19580.1 Lantibiotic dehydratase, C terminus [Nannocystis exedens]